ncbi:MAG: apolipoprotein N-acyltransferase, partial [bacterium]
LNRSRWRLLLVPAALVVCEAARGGLTGNAWALLGHAPRELTVLQIADLTGVAGLSFLLALTASVAAALCRELARRGHVGAALRRQRGALLAGATVVGAVLAYGSWQLRHPPAAATTQRALLVQGALRNDERGAGQAADAVQRYLALTAAAPAAPLIVWPENAIGVFPDENTALLAPLRNLVTQRGATLLGGAPRAGERAGRAAIYNSVYAFSRDGSRAVYDKRHLLPFVERFALRPQDGPYLPGGAPLPLSIGDARVGLLICYEVIDAGLARDAVAGGANLLINLSNDSWFDAGAGPAQHAAIARFRAIENRVSLLRATNSGVSAAYDASGRELARLPVDAAAAQIVEVPLSGGGTFYTRHGEWLALACLIAVGLGLCVGTRRDTLR